MSSIVPARIIWGLGVSLIVGYGTLFYGFSALVPTIAADIGKPAQWVYGALTIALIACSLVSPMVGKLADSHGAGRLMIAGSILSSLALYLTSYASNALWLAAGIMVCQVVATLMLYAVAFTAMVQIAGSAAQKSIVHLTLIAGFSSTLFWPLTSWLIVHLDWREVFQLFAALNLGVTLPIHILVARLVPTPSRPETTGSGQVPTRRAPIDMRLFLLMVTGFAIEAYALSAMLYHMVPLTQALGLGAWGVFVASLFGPAQVTSRLINLAFGRNLSQARLAVIAAVLLPLGLTVMLLTTPWFVGALVFAVCMGLGSGLSSIVGGTLPLELFGAEGYGARVGWSNAARQFASAVAPLAMSMSMAGYGVHTSLWIVVAMGLAGGLFFVAIAAIRNGPRA